jgi:hypothetical protein
MLEDRSEANIQWVLEITRQTPDDIAALLNANSLFLDYRDELRALEGKIPLCYLMRADREEIVAQWARENTPSAQVTAFGCDLNRSMQHLNSNYREEDVANEVSNEDLLHRSR